MNLSNIDWDLDNAGNWPVPVKAAVVVIICAALAGLGYYLDTQNQLAELETAQAKEAELKTTFENKQKKAANLDEYRAQLEEIEKSFGDLLRQLPDKTQVPELLVDVSQTGLASGLEFELFRPGGEIPKEFYAELPIDIRVVGDYMEFGAFISGLASLPRIVTVHNIKITGRKDAATGKGKALTMEALVKTYRYLEEGGVSPAQDKKTRRQP
ncbi:type 4a pilus biogenesis protein PilO [Methylococcus sp. EFPC2]|uniref:type 4a pilus biogenesis protein PilO n=1 Tax=Methylococcus sp. EFPC2 TaxID=2812648 RepID=UPI001967A8FB|nr:type 4a pilus biogenesis protein PilO [Methylococcus sp. EFPC2]QSA96199.1 type 4a pilus biogenesis protein PilO [Methylococcus sp. EFPC2]